MQLVIYDTYQILKLLTILNIVILYKYSKMWFSLFFISYLVERIIFYHKYKNLFKYSRD